jgi:hypothetical protein
MWWDVVALEYTLNYQIILSLIPGQTCADFSAHRLKLSPLLQS